MPQYSADMIQT